MDHALNEGQLLLQRTASDFFAKEFPLDRIRDFRLDWTTNAQQLWNEIGAMGWNAAPFPEELGGYPGNFLEAAVLLEQMGWAAAPTPFLHSTVASGLALAAVGHELAREIAGARAVVISAPIGPGIDLSIVSESSLSGTCWAVPWTEFATHYLVPFQGGVGLVAADDATACAVQSSGLEPHAMLDFAEGVVLARWDVSLQTAAELNGAAAGAMVMAGASARALDIAVSYMKERIQFGRPIGAFQALQHRAADMAIQNEVSRYLSFKAASRHGTPGFERSARYAKAYTSEASLRVCREAIQMHGGVGFVDDHKVQLFYRLCSDLSNAYGNSGAHRSAVTDLVLAEAAAQEATSGL